MNPIFNLSPSSDLTNCADSLAADLANHPQEDAQAGTYSEGYFDALYHNNTDPWHYQTRWYEKRKRDICLAVLPQAQYSNAIELGCGNGVFSELLASRCRALVSIDGNNCAVQLAKQRLASTPHARIIQGVIPEILFTLPEAVTSTHQSADNVPAHAPPFDLMIISEILYYLPSHDIDTVISWIGQNLAPGGTLLCCHWRYAIDDFVMTGETVHQRLRQAFGVVHDPDNNTNRQVIFDGLIAFNHQSQIEDTDFLLDVWQHSVTSVAKQENLL